jgi:uncharacterized membrane-anchored protein YitT (DUF2179 family)
MKQKNYINSIPWNLLLLTAGSAVFGIGIKAIAVPNGFITGGISGVGLLIYYAFGGLSPGQWFFLLNVPIFILGWIYVSRRFFFYSLYGMVALAAAIDLVRFQLPVHDPFLAMLAGGTLMGAGAGIILHSLGSGGGNDIIAIILHQKFSLRIGTFFFTFNLILFGLSLGVLELEPVLYSLAMSFVTAQVIDWILSMSNHRKMILVISDRSEEIARAVMDRLQRGATLIEGSGAYTGRRKRILLTVVHNYQLKRIEELVFGIDPDAFLITENTFNVLGKGFSHRKVY